MKNGLTKIVVGLIIVFGAMVGYGLIPHQGPVTPPVPIPAFAEEGEAFTVDPNTVAPLLQTQAAFSSIAEEMAESIVYVQARKKSDIERWRRYHSQQMPDGHDDMFEWFFNRRFEQQPNQPDQPSTQVPEPEFTSFGSGFFVDQSGYIITNYHVVEDAEAVAVTLHNRREVDAVVVGTDRASDLALLKVDAPVDFKILKLGDSDDLRVGSWVVAGGNPFSLRETITVGIVSAKYRALGMQPYERRSANELILNNYIQTDASINPGNSGGPLVDLNGEVVGVNTLIQSQGWGLGFAIPSNTVKFVYAQLKDNGKVERGFLGVEITDIDEEWAQMSHLESAFGVVVNRVTAGFPAGKAGVMEGDMILKVDNETIEDKDHLVSVISERMPGQKVTLDIRRGDREMEIPVTVGARPTADTGGDDAPEAETSSGFNALGLQLQGIDRDMAKAMKIPFGQGVLISSVDVNTKAYREGVRSGDVLLQLGSMQVNSVTEAEKALQEYRRKNPSLPIRVKISMQIEGSDDRIERLMALRLD